MENFNEMNMENENEGSVGKAIVFATIGMLIGMIPYLITGGIMDWRSWWIASISVGGAVSIGWYVGKGKSGAIRQVTVIILSIIGSILTIQLGYAIALYRFGYGADFMDALEWIFNVTIDGFGMMFDHFSSIFDNDNLPTMLAWDIVLTAGVAISVAWKKFNPNAGDEDLEDLDHNLEEVNGDRSIPTNTEMDEVLNQDVPSLDDDVLNEDVPTLEID